MIISPFVCLHVTTFLILHFLLKISATVNGVSNLSNVILYRTYETRINRLNRLFHSSVFSFCACENNSIIDFFLQKFFFSILIFCSSCCKISGNNKNTFLHEVHFYINARNSNFLIGHSFSRIKYKKLSSSKSAFILAMINSDHPLIFFCVIILLNFFENRRGSAE